MFDESLVVQSALSAFNNAALALPAFFWTGLLMLPLFYIVYKHGGKIMRMLDLEQNRLQDIVLKWTIGLSLIWLVLFGGNYVVLRDAESVLPVFTAVIAFLGMSFIGNVTRDIKTSQLMGGNKRMFMIACVLILTVIGLTDTHTWWGPLLQIGAFTGGLCFGRYILRKNIRAIPFVSIFLFLFTIMILMQPEFFRFGQLGNLTWLHLLGVALVGLPIVGSVMLRNVKPRGKIYQSAFVKLKWMMRCLVVLAGCMFVMTEAVPIFIGTCALVAGLIWLKIVHANTIPAYLANELLIISIFSFGLLTVMPVISCLAIFWWLSVPHGNLLQELHDVL